MKLECGLFLILLSPLFSFAQTFQDLHIDKNQNKKFTDLQEALHQRERVYHLDLSERNLTQIPAEVLEFPNLISIDLSKNRLRSIDQIDWSGLHSLEAVNLHDNQLSAFPIPLFACPGITELNISSNQIPEISFRIEEWKFLRVFKAQHNRIQQLPQNFKLSHLQELRLDGNRLTSLSKDFFLNNPKLSIVNLNNNLLSKIPESITKSNLSRLDVGANEIENAVIFESVTSLEYLILDRTILDLDALKAIANLHKLEILSLEHCGLTLLPDEVTKWTRLRELSLMHNELNQIPQDLLNLKRLEKLWLQHNPIDVDALIIPESLTVYY